MTRAVTTSFLLLLLTGITLSATSCDEYEAAYDIAQYTMQEEGRISYRKNYDLVNTIIDTATEYFAYCKKEISSADQYQLQQVIRKADKQRRKYFKGAVREYHAMYGIRPNVREIFQDNSGYSSGSSRTNGGYTSPTRLPPVRQPQMPSIQR